MGERHAPHASFLYRMPVSVAHGMQLLFCEGVWHSGLEHFTTLKLIFSQSKLSNYTFREGVEVLLVTKRCRSAILSKYDNLRKHLLTNKVQRAWLMSMSSFVSDRTMLPCLIHNSGYNISLNFSNIQILLL